MLDNQGTSAYKLMCQQTHPAYQYFVTGYLLGTFDLV